MDRPTRFVGDNEQGTGLGRRLVGIDVAVLPPTIVETIPVTIGRSFRTQCHDLATAWFGNPNPANRLRTEVPASQLSSEFREVRFLTALERPRGDVTAHSSIHLSEFPDSLSALFGCSEESNGQE